MAGGHPASPWFLPSLLQGSQLVSVHTGWTIKVTLEGGLMTALFCLADGLLVPYPF